MPLLSYAHISLTVSNNTEKPATAYIGTKFCSGDYGAMGIIEKHTKKAIPQFVIDTYCGKACDVKIYMTTDCSGEKVATLSVDKQKGIVNIINHDVDGYVVSGGGNYGQVDGGPKKNWVARFFNI